MSLFESLHPIVYPRSHGVLHGLGAFPAAYATQGGALLQAYADDAQDFVANMQHELDQVGSKNLMNVPADVMAGWLHGLDSTIAATSARDDMAGIAGAEEIKTSKEQMVSAMTNARWAMLYSSNGQPMGGQAGGISAYPITFPEVQGYLGGVSALAARLEARAREDDFTNPVPDAHLTAAEQAQVAVGEADWQTKIAIDKANATDDLCSPLKILTGETTMSAYFANCAPPWMKYVAIGVGSFVVYKVFRIGKRIAK